MILFTDTVLEEIDEAIAQKEPEQGGALLGAPDSNLISHFIYDEAARTTTVTYRPSKSLIQAVKDREQADGLQFKGIIHSHPGMMDHPSGQDHQAFASQLTHNLHMGRFIAPIVTRLPHNKKKLKSHELALGDGAKLSCYQARFSFDKAINDNQLSVTSCQVGLVRYSAAIKHLMDMLENEFDPVIEANSDVLMINGLLHIARMIKTPLFELQIFFPQNFPTVAPLILFSEYQGKKLGLAQSINLTWSIVDVHPAKLGERLLPLIVKKIKETENATTRPEPTTGNSIYKSAKQRGNTSRTKETGLC